MKIFYRILADAIFLFHGIVIAIILFGWALPEIWGMYMAILIVTFLSEVLLGYCFLSKWEFDLRKKINPAIDYNYSFSSYYTYKLTHRRLSEGFIRNAALVFLTGSLAINLAKVALF